MRTSLSTFVAVRYFFSKKSQRVINIISIISAIGVTIGTAALIIVLSVFNGFEDLILRLYNSFDPDLRIELVEGKTFDKNTIDLNALRKINGVKYLCETIDESALAKYHDKQYIIRLKGVSEDFRKMTGLDTMVLEGEFKLQNGDTDFAVVGSAVAYNLGISPTNIYNQVEIYAPRKNASVTDPEGAFNRRFISPSGIFSVQQEFDTRYILVPLRFAEDVFDDKNKLSALEINLKEGTDPSKVQSSILSQLGNKFKIIDRFHQHETLYKIMKSEKWAVFLILTFILIIAIFNVISSLTMLVIDKKKDIAIYQSMGADIPMLRKIFLKEGMMITFSGAIVGLAIGFIVCLVQIQFGLIKLSGAGTFIIDSYPVKMSARDFVYIFITVNIIGFVAAWYPTMRLIKGGVSVKGLAEDS